FLECNVNALLSRWHRNLEEYSKCIKSVTLSQVKAIFFVRYIDAIYPSLIAIHLFFRERLAKKNPARSTLPVRVISGDMCGEFALLLRKYGSKDGLWMENTVPVSLFGRYLLNNPDHILMYGKYCTMAPARTNEERCVSLAVTFSPSSMQERIQKILSGRGVASRRKAEEYIEQGLVKVNGKVATLGQKADADVDKIEVDGKVLQERKEMMYYVMNKPVGVETSNVDTKTIVQKKAAAGKPIPKHLQPPKNAPPNEVRTVRDLLSAQLVGKIYPVGRLDKDSGGLLLFTNDGVLAYRLTHPTFTHEKEYEVVLGKPIEPLALKKLEEGFILDGSMTKPLKAWKVGPAIIRMILTEGRNRQIRRMCQNVGYTVKELKRVRIMTLEDNRLKAGFIRELSDGERKALLKSVDLDPEKDQPAA
ncbi:MAG: rRNA pseudouridine2604 synthase, partial [Candidatus Peribacteria bacterium]|nr:rRNA pseudouridine2604 synthase [Candidatus Peribacteria bacterium]